MAGFLVQGQYLLNGRLHAAISGTVPVSFSLPRRCEWGQAFYISGEAEALGAWNLDKAVPLNWTENHVWTNTIDLAVGTGTEYKFVLIGKRGHVEWQPGPNSRVDVPSDSFAPLSVLSPWDHTAGPESPPTPEEQEKEKEEAYEMLSKLSSTVKLKVAMERFEEGNENGAYTSRKAFGSRAASPFDGGFLAKDAQLVRQVFARLLGSLGRQTLMDEEKNKDQK
eukprot:TRINITY_DN544_c0_g1_i3.p1 TRINITY_DN544_c0_g1~~TRINITY_DN544_c0_g1_i3.p1  ORF type:complete len:223 (+),score=41.57 TRINITY_DN544_c0_g1_i3:84-752(+)